MEQELRQTLPIYHVPSESMWRAFELRVLRDLKSHLDLRQPILEIGCGDGAFGSLVFSEISNAIDLNPRVVSRCSTLHGDVYRNVSVMDARNMNFADQSHETVFANCVIEHIPDLRQVLASAFRILRPGGVFITTVPLTDMNQHLAFHSEKYAIWRQKRLQHVNLLTLEEWKHIFLDAGFSAVDDYPYLSGKNCKLWDKLDTPLTIGFGRYRIGSASRWILRNLPVAVQQKTRGGLAQWLSMRIEDSSQPACASALVAYKPHND